MDEFDDPGLDELFSSMPDVAMKDPAPPPPHEQEDDHSDLSTDFESDASSEFSDPGFDDDVVALVDKQTTNEAKYLNKPEYHFGNGGRQRYSIRRGPGDLSPADPAASPRVAQTLCCPPPTDVDCVRVNQVCGFQSPDMRFGPGARAYMHKYLVTHYTVSGPVDDEDDIAAIGRAEAGGREGNAVEAYDCYEADGRVVDARDWREPAKAESSLEAASPQPEEASMPLGDLPETYGTESWKTPSAYAEFAEKGPKVRKPPPVSRARLNLVALSQKYNLFFAAFKSEIHVFRPQPAPEIVRGALLVLCPEPTEAAILIGGYHSQSSLHQVNHMIVGYLGNLEILLMAYNDGDVFAYYTHQIVEYLSHKFRGHPTRAPPKPVPFFRETVGISAWGLAIHSKSRLIAVSSKLAGITVFSPALDDPYGLTIPDQQDTFIPGDIDSVTLSVALRRRRRSWRILLPVGQGNSNISNIAFMSSFLGEADWIVATDLDGFVFFLSIYGPLKEPLKMRVGQAKKMTDMGWGVLPILKAQLINTKAVPRRCPAALSRSHGLMNHGLNYSLVLDPSTDAIISKPIKHYDVSNLDRYILPRVPYTMRMLFELDCVEGGEIPRHYSGKNYHDENDEDGEDDEEEDDEEEDDEDWSSDYVNDDDYLLKIFEHYTGRESMTTDGTFPHSINNPSRIWLPDLINPTPILPPRIRDLPFQPVNLHSGFQKSLVACPGTSQTWATPTLLGLIGVLRSALRHDSILSIPLPMGLNVDHSRPTLRYNSPAADQAGALAVAAVATTAAAGQPVAPMAAANFVFDHSHDDDEDDDDDDYDYEDHEEDFDHDSVTDHDDLYWQNLKTLCKKYVIFQTLSNGAQMFEPDDHTPVYQVDNITSFTADEPRHRAASMVDMNRPYSRHSMIHFIPEISLLVVGKMQGQVVLLRPLSNGISKLSQHLPSDDWARRLLYNENHTPFAFRTEWTLPLQKDRTSEKYPLCCLLGIAVSPVPEFGADHYGYKNKEEEWKRRRADGEEMPQPQKAEHLRRRWRLIMYYMDHTILQYYIQESESGNGICDVQPVLQEAQLASAERQRADPKRPRYVDGMRV